MTDTELWYKYNSFRLRKVKQYSAAVNSALKEQLQYFADFRHVDSIPQTPVSNVIKAIYLDAGRLWAHQAYINIAIQTKNYGNVTGLQLKGRMPIGFNEDFINEILKYFETRLLLEAVVPITETTKNIIREALRKGEIEGTGIDEIVQNILKSGITSVRANLIARTEIMKAANYGEQIGINKTGLQTNKIWIAVRDNRTRFDHVNVDNQVVPDGEEFTVGGYKMQRPGVSTSDNGIPVPAKEIVNCRCVVGRRVLRDSRGLPLRS